MRNPNGYGSVYKLSGKRRRPWIVRKTIGYDENTGHQKYITIGYYKTQAEANIALAEYNSAPYDLEIGQKTFSEIYELWSKDFFKEDTNRSTKKNYTNAYDHCSELYRMKMSEIRTHHLQHVLDEAESEFICTRQRILFGKMYKWLIKNDAIKRNYAEGLEKPKSEAKEMVDETKKKFSTDELLRIWDAAEGNIYVQFVLMLIYSGVRINEILNLKKEDVHLEEQYFLIRHSKTAAGLRVVPIADAVLPFWKTFYERSPQCEYLISTDNAQPMTDSNFRKRYWYPLKEKLNFDHVVHETRHTCISLLKAANVNDTLIKKIVGHKSKMDLTEKTYTHYEITELVEAINKIEVKGLILPFRRPA